MDDLKNLLRTRLVLPEDNQYKEASSLWNGMHSPRPAAIAFCTSSEEVSAVLRLASRNALGVTVRGGGHNVAGTALRDGYLAIDLRLMNQVHVNVSRMRATAQGGCLLSDVDDALAPHALALPAGVVGHTGLGGLALGGGYGWLARRDGLTCDHLVEAEVVLADGRIVVASAENDASLYWALKGGGGGYGVVTSFTFNLRSAPPVRLTRWRAPARFAEDAFAAHREESCKQTRESHIVGSFGYGILKGSTPEPLVSITEAWFGQGDTASPIMDALRSVGHGASVTRETLTYRQLQALGDHGEPSGHRYYTKSAYLTDLPPEAGPQLAECFGQSPSPLASIDFEFLRGAISDTSEGAFPNRHAAFICTISAHWQDQAEDPSNVSWAREAISRVAPWRASGAYSNYLQDESPKMLEETFGSDRMQRLLQVKRLYDPVGLFA